MSHDEQLPKLHPGVTVLLSPVVVYGFCSLWLNITSNSLHQQLLELSQTIPMVKVWCLHRLESVIYHYMSVPVPPMPPEVPTRNPVMPVCHMEQELYVMVDLCVFLFMWWPRGCGWNSRLSLQSIDYLCSLRLYVFVRISLSTRYLTKIICNSWIL